MKLQKNRALSIEVFKWIKHNPSISDREIVEKLKLVNYKISAPSIAKWRKEIFPEFEKEFETPEELPSFDKFTSLSELHNLLKIVKERINALQTMIDEKVKQDKDGKITAYLSEITESHFRDYIALANKINENIIKSTPDINIIHIIQYTMKEFLRLTLTTFSSDQEKLKWNKFKQDVLDLEVELKSIFISK